MLSAFGECQVRSRLRFNLSAPGALEPFGGGRPSRKLLFCMSMRLLPFQQFGTLMFNAFLDIIRQPIVLLLVATSLAVTSLLPMVSLFMFGEEVRLVQDGALALQLGMGLLLAGTAASAALFQEIHRGTAAAVLCKPVSRPLFFLAKYGGVLLVLALFCVFSLAVTLLSVRLPLAHLQTDWRLGGMLYAVLPTAFLLAAGTNFIFRRPFVSQAFAFLAPCLGIAFLVGAGLDPTGHWCAYGSLLAWRLAPVSVLIGLALAVFAALALSLSTRLAPAFTLSIAGAVFLLGLLADYLFAPAAARSLLAALCYAALPNGQNFWLIDTLASGAVIPWGYVLGAAIYAGLLIAGLLCFGLAAFRHVEIH